MFDEFKGIIVETPMAEFGFAIDSPQTTLDRLYENGWWITEIFGSYATIVRRKDYPRGRHFFISRSVAIDVRAITPRAQKTIDRIAKQQWKKYQRFMKPKDKFI